MILAQRAAAARGGGCVLSATTASSQTTATRSGLFRVRPMRRFLVTASGLNNNTSTTTSIHNHWLRRQEEGRYHHRHDDAFCSSFSLHKLHTQSSSSLPLSWSHDREEEEHDDHHSYRSAPLPSSSPPAINIWTSYPSTIHVPHNNNNNNNNSRFFSTQTKDTASNKKQKSTRKQQQHSPTKKKSGFGETTTTTTKTLPQKKKPQTKAAKKRREKQKSQRQQRKSSRTRQLKRQLRIQEIQNNSILHHHSSSVGSDDTTSTEDAFQRQTEDDLGKLFDAMALDYTLVWTDNTCKRIKEKIHWLLLQQQQTAEKQRRDSVDDDDDDSDDSDDNHHHLFGTAVTQIVAVLLETTNPNDTLQIKILEQLLGIETTAAPAPSPNQKDEAAVRSKQSTPYNKPTREDYKLAALLMKARERAVRLQQPLFWNKQDLQQRQQLHDQQKDVERRRLERHVAKSNQQLRDEALQLVLLLRAKLPKKYFLYVVSVFENYVGWNDSNDSDGDRNNMVAAAVEQPKRKKKTLEEVYELNQGSSDSDSDHNMTAAVEQPPKRKKKTLEEVYELNQGDDTDNDNNSTASSSGGGSVSGVDKKGHLPLRRLGKHLIRTARTHLFHVAEPVASFFYIIDDDDEQPSLVATDPSVVHSRNRWNKSRRFFIKTMMGLQDKMVTCIQEENDKTLASMQQKLDENKLPRPLDADDDDDTQKVKKGAKKKKKTRKKKKSSIDDKQLQVVATNQLKEEVAESKKRREEKEQESEDANSKKKKGSRGRPSRRLHVAHYVLDAMYVHEPVNKQHVNGSSTSADIINGLGINGSSRSSSSLLLPSQSKVLIDNLPIDITQEEVTQLYSRCGDLASVQLYNQRPDLDPGPLSRTELELRRKSQSVLAGRRHRRQQLQRQQRHQSWHRPKTPVYAILTFEDSTGFDRAVDDTLRIFGMMIQRHPSRSIRSSELQSLFIEPFVVPYSDSDNDDDKNTSRQNEADDRERRRANAADLVYEVGQLMGPDFLVSLESGHSHPNTQKVSMGSCEIKFPSFEVALEAYETLNRELSLFQHSYNYDAVESVAAADDDGDQDTTLPMWTVNWIRTPRDALEWWTRKRGFDP